MKKAFQVCAGLLFLLAASPCVIYLVHPDPNNVLSIESVAFNAVTRLIGGFLLLAVARRSEQRLAIGPVFVLATGLLLGLTGFSFIALTFERTLKYGFQVHGEIYNLIVFLPTACLGIGLCIWATRYRLPTK